MKTIKLGALILSGVMGLTALCAPALATDAPEAEPAQGQYSLTVNPGAEEDIENSDVKLDLYYIASATADGQYDTWHYTMQEPYSALTIPENVTNDGWQALAQQAAQIALGSEERLSPVVSQLPPHEKAEGLESGLYLVIARGEGEDYVTNLREGGEDAGMELVTTARSQNYVYTYAPQLVTLPGKEAKEDGSVGTAGDYGEWLSDMSVTLKPDQSVRCGTLSIEKTVSGFGSEPAMFLFQIEGSRTSDGAHFSDVVAMTFNAAGTDTYTLDRIPVGAEVTVTEVYSGAAYTPTGEESQTAIIPAEGAASVEFVNTYNGSANSGSAVVNHFSYLGEEQGWDWNGSASRAPQD